MEGKSSTASPGKVTGQSNNQQVVNEPKDPQDVAQMVQALLQQMQSQFQNMSDQILNRIDDMGSRIDDLEKNLNDLMANAGIQPEAGDNQSNVCDSTQGEK